MNNTRGGGFAFCCGSQEAAANQNNVAHPSATSTPSPVMTDTLSLSTDVSAGTEDSLSFTPVTKTELDNALDSLCKKITSSVTASITKSANEMKTQIVGDLKKQINAFKVELKQVNERVTKVENDIVDVKLRLSNIDATPAADVDSLCVKIVNETRRELRELDRRASNAIILGFTEYENNAADLSNFNNLLREFPGLPLVKSTFRLGREKIADKIRPLKIIMHSSNDVKTLFRNKNNLESKNLKIVSDKTPLETQYLNHVRTQLNERVLQGETDLTIKYVNNIPTIVQQKTLERKIYC